MPNIDRIFRAAGPGAVADLGLLSDLPGRWAGHGFNLIARPARQGVAANPVFFLELNATNEVLRFETIGGDIPNRGDSQPTAILHGLHYLQVITDCADGSALHLEPGLWVHDPEEDNYFRQATIPHGTSLIAMSNQVGTVPSGPQLDPVLSFPFSLSDPIPDLFSTTHTVETDPQYLDPYLHDPLPESCLPAGLDAADVIKDPVGVLRAQIVNQVITETKIIRISTAFHSPNSASPLIQGTVNIPFVATNANCPQMDAVFWIEAVNNPTVRGQSFLQLQYIQRIVLDFENLHWPHFNCATLVKAG